MIIALQNSATIPISQNEFSSLTKNATLVHQLHPQKFTAHHYFLSLLKALFPHAHIRKQSPTDTPQQALWIKLNTQTATFNYFKSNVL